MGAVGRTRRLVRHRDRVGLSGVKFSGPPNETSQGLGPRVNHQLARRTIHRDDFPIRAGHCVQASSDHHRNATSPGQDRVVPGRTAGGEHDAGDQLRIQAAHVRRSEVLGEQNACPGSKTSRSAGELAQDLVAHCPYVRGPGPLVTVRQRGELVAHHLHRAVPPNLRRTATVQLPASLGEQLDVLEKEQVSGENIGLAGA